MSLQIRRLAGGPNLNRICLTRGSQSQVQAVAIVQAAPSVAHLTQDERSSARRPQSCSDRQEIASCNTIATGGPLGK